MAKEEAGTEGRTQRARKWSITWLLVFGRGLLERRAPCTPRPAKRTGSFPSNKMLGDSTPSRPQSRGEGSLHMLPVHFPPPATFAGYISAPGNNQSQGLIFLTAQNDEWPRVKEQIFALSVEMLCNRELRSHLNTFVVRGKSAVHFTPTIQMSTSLGILLKCVVPLLLPD